MLKAIKEFFKKEQRKDAKPAVEFGEHVFTVFKDLFFFLL
jgi:hypothetical protein